VLSEDPNFWLSLGQASSAARPGTAAPIKELPFPLFTIEHDDG
jgi:hypothetical protein